jgi:hypothetical protein
LASQCLLDRLKGFAKIVELGDGVVGTDKLVAQGVEHGLGVEVFLEAHEGRPLKAFRTDEPAGELGGERGLALAAGAAHHRPRLAVQQALQRQQLAAAALKVMRRRRGQVAQAQPAVLRLGRRLSTPVDDPGVLLFLEEHRHEPVLETELTCTQDLASPGVLK